MRRILLFNCWWLLILCITYFVFYFIYCSCLFMFKLVFLLSSSLLQLTMVLGALKCIFKIKIKRADFFDNYHICIVKNEKSTLGLDLFADIICIYHILWFPQIQHNVIARCQEQWYWSNAIVLDVHLIKNGMKHHFEYTVEYFEYVHNWLLLFAASVG